MIDADIRDVTPVLAGGGYEIYVSRREAVKGKVTAAGAGTPDPRDRQSHNVGLELRLWSDITQRLAGELKWVAG